MKRTYQTAIILALLIPALVSVAVSCAKGEITPPPNNDVWTIETSVICED